MKGKFIVVEGLDYSGKSSAINELKKMDKCRDIIFTREPGGTDVSLAENIRNFIFEQSDVDPLTEAYLFAASRAAHTAMIEKWINEGKTVICDRYLYSSLYYQGIMKNVGIDTVYSINESALRNLTPDIIFYFSVSEEEKNRRMSSRNEINRLDKEVSEISHYKADMEYFKAIDEYKEEEFTQVISIDTTYKTPIQSAQQMCQVL